MHRKVTIKNIVCANDAPLVLLAGPCALESLDHSLMLAKAIKAETMRHGMGFVFKGSFDKANRSSVKSARGVGLDEGLAILEGVAQRMECPVMTDIHNEAQAAAAGEVVDIVQIPAFLCRQTDLLLAASKTGRAVNIKKGQFMAPWHMAQAAAKVASTGNHNIMLTERGSSFGYQRLVTDFCALPIMQETGYPVIFDATHSVQQPSALGETSGGTREFIAPLARAAAAVGCAGLFIEVHEKPARAPSDGATMLPLDQLASLLSTIAVIDDHIKKVIRDSHE